jgi:hypothetical protein
LAVSFQFFAFSFFRSSMTSSCHHFLGLPNGLVPIGFQSNSFLVGRAWSILWICPSHLLLGALKNLTISVPSMNIDYIYILTFFCIKRCQIPAVSKLHSMWHNELEGLGMNHLSSYLEQGWRKLTHGIIITF